MSIQIMKKILSRLMIIVLVSLCACLFFLLPIQASEINESVAESDTVTETTNETLSDISIENSSSPGKNESSHNTITPNVTDEINELNEEIPPIAKQTSATQTVLYLDGRNGNDANDGFSKEKPLRSFAKAKALAQANPTISDIVVLDTVAVEGKVSLAGTAAKLVRGEGFTGHLLKIDQNTSAEFSDITVDGAGGGERVDALLRVDGAMQMRSGTILENNKSMAAAGTASPTRGGGIYAYRALIEIYDGIIRNNQASYGGGIFLNNNSQLTMMGGEISGNRAHRYRDTDVNQIYAAGGGVLIYEGSKMILSDGRIIQNISDEIGGGIAAGGQDWSNGHATLEMTGGLVDGNEAGAAGGGIFIQVGLNDNYAIGKITAGNITNNRMNGSGYTEKAFGGGGIYVNGMPTEYYGSKWTNGQLHLTNAVITNNVATYDGAGYAACPISKTYIYVTNGVAIYDNQLQNDNQSRDLYFLSSRYYGPHSGRAEFEISDRMLGGQPYYWKYKSGEIVKPEALKGVLPDGQSLSLYTDEVLDATGMALGKVLISGNTSATRGAGIGSNGTVYMGTNEPPVDLEVVKTWEAGLTPEPITVELRAKLDDLDWPIETVELNPSNGFKHLFKNLPASINDQPIENLLYIKETTISDRFTPEISPLTVVEPIRTFSFKINREEMTDKEYVSAVYHNYHINHPETGVFDREAWKLNDFKVLFHLKNSENGEIISSQAMTYTASTEENLSPQWNGEIRFDDLPGDGNHVEFVYYDEQGTFVAPWNLEYDLFLEKVDEKTIIKIPLLWPMNIEADKLKDFKGRVLPAEITQVSNSTDKIFRIALVNKKPTVKPELHHLTVTKRWIGDEAPAIDIQLLRNGEVFAQARLSKAEGWTYTFRDLLLKDDKGVPYRYHIKETPIAGYSSTITGDMHQGFIIINKKDTPPPETPPKNPPDEPNQRRVYVNKTWIGPAAQEAVIYLLADGKIVDQAVLRASNHWQHIFGNLVKEKDGKLIQYTIQEKEIPGYRSQIIGNERDGFCVINSNENNKIDIPVIKQWLGKEASMTEVHLYQDDKLFDTVSISKAQGWQHVFKDMPIFDPETGHLYRYSIKETPLADYQETISGTATEGFLIVNKECLISPSKPEVPKAEAPKQIISQYPGKEVPKTGTTTDLFFAWILLSGAFLILRNKHKTIL